jgi:1,4-dihydroxy-2-naphthoate octaprenyltransferase
LTLLGAVVAHAGINVLNGVYDDRAGCDAIDVDRVFPHTGGSRIIQSGVLTNGRMALYGWLRICVLIPRVASEIGWCASASTARGGYPLLVAAAYFSLLLGVVLVPIPRYALIGLAALPLHLHASRLLWMEADNRQALRPVISLTLIGTIMYGALIAIGIAVGRLL